MYVVNSFIHNILKKITSPAIIAFAIVPTGDAIHPTPEGVGFSLNLL